MKVATFIFTFYLILLSAVPCCAFDGCPDDKNAMEQTANHEQGDKDNCGTCSPFFNCEGCCSATTHSGTVTASVLPVTSKPVYAAFIPAAIPLISYDFWQPPKRM